MRNLIMSITRSIVLLAISFTGPAFPTRTPVAAFPAKPNSTMEHVVKKSIDIQAEPADVWAALTTPELTQKYFFHSKVYSDWKVGSPIVFKGKLFLIKKFEMKGRIEAIEPGKLLKYTLSNGSDDNKSTSTVTDVLTYRDGITTVAVTDDVGEGEGAEKRFKRSEKGWERVLKGLKKTVESIRIAAKNSH